MDHAKTHPAKSAKVARWLIPILILAVAMAIFYWPEVSVKEKVFFVRLKPANLSGELIISGNPPAGIEARLRGPSHILNQLSGRSLPYMLDLSGAEPGQHLFPIEPEGLSLPPNVNVVDFEPENVVIALAKRMKKTVPVSVAISGNPAAGFRVGGAVATPLAVELTGPEEVLVDIEKVSTKPVEVSGARKPFKTETTISLPEGVENVRPSNLFSVEIFISEIIQTKTFEDIPVMGKNTSHQADISPGRITLEVKGPRNVLEKLNPLEDIEAYVDLQGLKPGVYARRAVITLPVETTLVGARPEVFTIAIKK